MRPAAIVLGFVAGIFTGGALLAPWVYWTVQELANAAPLFANLSQNPFHRYVHRCILILALGGLWFFARQAGFRSWASVGLRRQTDWLRRWGQGFGLGWIMLALVAALEFGCGARQWRGDVAAADWARMFAWATGAAVAVSILEELVFRGILFGYLRATAGLGLGVVGSSLIYAWLHFFARPSSPDPVEWTSGLLVLGQMLRGFLDWNQLLPGLINLIFVGAILAIAYKRTGTLYFSIGLHAGWIFWLKFYGAISIAGALNERFWGTGKLIDSWVATPILVAAVVCVSRWVGPGPGGSISTQAFGNEGITSKSEVEKLA